MITIEKENKKNEKEIENENDNDDKQYEAHKEKIRKMKKKKKLNKRKEYFISDYYWSYIVALFGICYTIVACFGVIQIISLVVK